MNFSCALVSVSTHGRSDILEGQTVVCSRCGLRLWLRMPRNSHRVKRRCGGLNRSGLTRKIPFPACGRSEPTAIMLMARNLDRESPLRAYWQLGKLLSPFQIVERDLLGVLGIAILQNDCGLGPIFSTLGRAALHAEILDDFSFNFHALLLCFVCFRLFR